jgi:mannose-6-phosphate isomerase-like protein (cupin superfamily)
MHETIDPENDRWFLGTLMRFHVTADSSGGRYTVTEQVAPRGFSPPLHFHLHEDGLMYVLEGSMTVVVGDDRRSVAAGQAVFLPRGVGHTFRVDSERVRLLEIVSPGGIETFYRNCGEPAKQLELPATTVFDPEKVQREAELHGARLLGPPLT